MATAQNQNNVATQQPLQFIAIPDAGSYYVAIQVVSGPNPGHIEFVGFNDTNGAVTVSTTLRQRRRHVVSRHASGTTRVPNTIGVGATPWWAPPSSLGSARTRWRTSRSARAGPALQVFNVDGRRR